MVARLGARQGQHGRRKEHGLIVRMGNQQTHALLQQLREAVAHGVGGADVDARHGGDNGGSQHQQGVGVDGQVGQLEAEVEGQAEAGGHGGDDDGGID